jgi:hypothetical protein
MEATMAKAKVSFSEETGQIKIVVPPGTKWNEVGKIVELCTTTVIIPPRICNTCLSGRPLYIVEDAGDVTQVELDK